RALQARDHHLGLPTKRRLIPLRLDADYEFQPFELNTLYVDAVNKPEDEWLAELRRALLPDRSSTTPDWTASATPAPPSTPVPSEPTAPIPARVPARADTAVLASLPPAGPSPSTSPPAPAQRPWRWVLAKPRVALVVSVVSIITPLVLILSLAGQ